MRQDAPKIGATLTIVGGLVVLAVNAMISINNTRADWESILGYLLAIDLVLAAVATSMGVLMTQKPESRTTWGVIAIICAIPSLPFGFSGFVIGIVLIVVGAVLAMRFKPPVESTSAVAPPPRQSQ